MLNFVEKWMNKIRRMPMLLDQKINRIFIGLINVESEYRGEKLYPLFKFAFYCVLIVFVINLFSIGSSSFGEWGDFFGGVLNPLLTFIMFMGLLITIVLQQTELGEARKQFTRSADALQAQEAVANLRAFETTFFSLVRSFNDATAQIDLINKEGVVTRGRDCFSAFYTRLNRVYRNKYDKHHLKFTDRDILVWSFDIFMQQNEQNLSHYFRSLATLIKFAAASPHINHVYFDIVQSHLSDRELLLLFYYCATDRDIALRSLVEQHAVLKEMQTQYLLRKDHSAFLQAGAFGPEGGRRCAVRQPVGIR